MNGLVHDCSYNTMQEYNDIIENQQYFLFAGLLIVVVMFFKYFKMRICSYYDDGNNTAKIIRIFF